MQDNPQMTMKITLEQLVEIARTAEYKNPIDWGELPIDEETVYRVYAGAVYTSYSKTSLQNKDIVMLASLIKLHVENFVLQQTVSQLQHTISKLQRVNRTGAPDSP
jgi:hypothetical protein